MELDHPRVKHDRISTFSAKLTNRERMPLKFSGLFEVCQLLLYFASHVKQINGRQRRHKPKLLKIILHATKLYFECINY